MAPAGPLTGRVIPAMADIAGELLEEPAEALPERRGRAGAAE